MIPFGEPGVRFVDVGYREESVMEALVRREDLHDMTMVMVLAAIQADGKELAQLSEDEKQTYIDAAVADLKFAIDLTGG